MADKIVTRPVQVFVIGFEKPDFDGRILAELNKARKRGVIRLVDLLFVARRCRGRGRRTTMTNAAVGDTCG